MTRPFGTPETPRGRKGWKQNSNGKRNNWATNLFPLNPRLHNLPAQHVGVPWKTLAACHSDVLATFLSEDRVKHARSYMKSIFAEAVEQDFLLKDPTRGIKVPRNLREKDKTTLTWHQLRAVLAGVAT